MIELGLSRLVQADAAVQELCPAGGFYVEVPKGRPLPNWSYRMFGGHPVQATRTFGGVTMRRCQVDVIGADADAAAVITLARAIDKALNGFTGQLFDDDFTRVDSVLRAEEPIDTYDFERRGFRRMLEYEVWFYE